LIYIDKRLLTALIASFASSLYVRIDSVKHYITINTNVKILYHTYIRFFYQWCQWCQSS
jgi:hypothetical protein